MSKSREQLLALLKQIDISDKVVLDAGAGSKEHWVRNWTKGNPQEYITMDVEDFGVDLVGDLNLRGEEWLLKTLDKADIVFCLETLEHLWDPLTGVKNIYWSLKPGGTAYFSTPWLNPYHDMVDYARYTDEWYEKVLTEAGFKNIKITPRLATEGYEHLMEFYKAEGLKFSKIRAGQEEKLKYIGFFVEATK